METLAAIPGFPSRRLISLLTLVSHLTATLGAPLPAPDRPPKAGASPFPCQDRPCGCPTADECWKGDCCCFTIEQKLAWAEARGVAPPPHVRPLVESRKARPATKQKACCAAEPRATGDERGETVPPGNPGVRWVVGVFAQKCRGDGPAGCCSAEPAPAPDLSPFKPTVPDGSGVIAAYSDFATPRLSAPPTPPPRTV